MEDGNHGWRTAWHTVEGLQGWADMRLAHKYSLTQGTCGQCDERGVQVWQHWEKKKAKDYCARCWLAYYDEEFVQRNGGAADEVRRKS